MAQNSADPSLSELTDALFSLFVLSDDGSAFQPVPSADRFGEALKKESVRGLVLYTPPQRKAAHLLAELEDPEKTLQQWRFEATGALKICRRLRSRILIAERPESEEAAVSTYATIEHTFPGSNFPRTYPQPQLPDRFWTAAGLVCVLQSSATVQLLGELQVRSPASFDELPGLETGFEQLLACHRQALRRKADEASVRLEELTEQIDGLESSVFESEAACGALRNSMTETMERERLLIGQIGELEESLLDSAVVEEQLAREIAKLKTKLDVRNRSFSWRITAPLRAVARGLNRSGRKA